MILCCGEALIDMVPVLDDAGATTYAPLSGGAIFNTAIALGRLQASVGLVSGVSTDLFGAQLVETLQASNVATDLLMRSARPTTLAFVKLTDGHADYTFYDENSAGRMIGADDLPTLPDTVSTLYFGGISLCAEPAASVYETLFLREAGRRVTMLDPNIRAGFITDETAYRVRLDRLMAAADIVKVSDEDLDWIDATKATLDIRAQGVLDRGAQIVIVTKGSAGATAYLSNGERVDVSVPKVTVVDTVGAGDTFNAGFLAQLQGSGHLSKAGLLKLDAAAAKSALEYAAQVAAVTVSRSGANPPYLEELER